MRRLVWRPSMGVSLFAAVLAGVAGLPASIWASSEGVRPDLVVYSARIEQLIKPMFDAFTARTGIGVRAFSASEAELFERLKAEGTRTPADMLMTVDVGNLWLAQEAALLQSFASPVIEKNIPGHLRAKGNEWVGLSVRARTIAYGSERVKPTELSTYEALGDPRWKGRLCLRTSKKVYNQSMVATMIKTLGEKRTEEVVRGWMANDPRIFSSDTKLIEAIAAGQCDVGLVNTYYLAQLKAKEPSLPVALFWPNQQDRGVHVNISGAGVTKHAKRRAEAIRLIEFLSTAEAQNLYADVNYEYPANPAVKPNALLAAWGSFRADQVDVAAAGEFQAAAVRLMDRVGWR
jgi:iron(III) transport system substrate-binding protein